MYVRIGNILTDSDSGQIFKALKESAAAFAL
jgi:hypothetical protein